MYHYRRIRDLREDNDLKQTTIARILEISQQQYGLYENGKREIPVHLMIKLAKYYNVSLDYLTGLINEPATLNSKNKNWNLNSKQCKILKEYALHPEHQNTIDKILDIER